MLVARWNEISVALATVDVVDEMEKAFLAYSSGLCVVPPVGELCFADPPGDVHIKYGYIRGDEFYVVKVASGFYQNPTRNLPSGNGLMLLFRQETGEPAAILLDDGHLTDIRTAAAGAVAARHLAPKNLRRIGILGSGTQARLQLEYLAGVTECRSALVWGRDAAKLDRFVATVGGGFEIETTQVANDVAERCNLIVTTTPSETPLIAATAIQPGTHITAVGSDTPVKQELDPAVLALADVVVADSREQCKERGEIAHALESGQITFDEVIELGAVVRSRLEAGERTRVDDTQVTVADLTGVAVQDVRIASAVYSALLAS